MGIAFKVNSLCAFVKHCEELLLCWLAFKTGQFVTFKRLMEHTVPYTEKTTRHLANAHLSFIPPSVQYVRWICNYRPVIHRQKNGCPGKDRVFFCDGGSKLCYNLLIQEWSLRFLPPSIGQRPSMSSS